MVCLLILKISIRCIKFSETDFEVLVKIWLDIEERGANRCLFEPVIQ